MIKLEAGLSRLKECYLFAHLTFSILTITCFLEWLKLKNIYFDSYMYLWIACLVVILALVPAQHIILTKTFYRDFNKLNLYKIIYSTAICIIYTPILIGIYSRGNTGVLIIVPVILNSIICGTYYGMITSMVVTISMILFTNKFLFTPEFLTGNILTLAVLMTTSWFTGQSFEYIKNLLHQLTESELTYKNILDNLGIATLYLDGYSGLLEGNQRFEELIGTNGHNDMDLNTVIERHLPFLKASLETLIEGEGITLFGQASDSNGNLTPVHCVAYPTNRNMDKDQGLVICVNDISLSERLQEEKVRTNLFIDFLNSGLILADESGNVIEMNRQSLGLLDLTKEAAIGKNFLTLLTYATGRTIDLSTTKTSFEVEMNGKFLLITWADLRKSSDKILGSMCIINDITDQKELEKKLHRSATLSAIGELAAGTAHEIRNPLTSIKGFLQLIMEKRDAKIGDYKSYFEIMIDEVNRINNIVTEFLKLSKPNKLILKQINLNEVVDSIWDLLRSEAAAKDIQLDLEMEQGDSGIMGNTDGLKQVIINLVSNACQAAGPGGTVKVALTRDKNRATLSVQDNGPGIDEAVLPRIFDPFFTTRDEGTGLGLAITSKIIDDHNAVINVTSRPSQGTTFLIKFPLPENGRPGEQA